MYKLSLVLLVMNLPVYAMLGPITRYAKPFSHVGGSARAEMLQSRAALIQKRAYSRYGNAIREIIEIQGGFSFNDLYFTQQLTNREQVEVLKEVMRAVKQGEETDFSFSTGGADNGSVYCGSDNDGSREMQFSDLKGDWTKGEFTALAQYLESVRVLKEIDQERKVAQWKCDQKEKAAHAIIKGIMRKNEITEEDLMFKTKNEDQASRWQE